MGALKPAYTIASYKDVVMKEALENPTVTFLWWRAMQVQNSTLYIETVRRLLKQEIEE